MWIEYSIPAAFDIQKQIIRHLKNWIESINEQGLIKGFAFNHYFGQEGFQDDLRVRFDYPSERNLDVEDELSIKVREFIPDYSTRGTPWDNREQILKGYEFGSRCAFLFWQMVEKGRFQEEFLSSYLRFPNSTHAELKTVPFDFQSHFYHGVMNSLGVAKQPNELLLHLLAIIESKHFHNSEELCIWMRTLSQNLFRIYQ